MKTNKPRLVENPHIVNSVLTAILLLGIAWIWFSRVANNNTTGGKIPAPQPGFLAPEFSLAERNGEMISLSSLRGKPVLLNIWASWCPPCRSEMPAMQDLFEEYVDQGFTILAVNATNQDDLEEMNRFVENNQLQFPVLLDQTGTVTDLYKVQSLPTSFFINKEGIIEDVVFGGMSEALLRIRVQALLNNLSAEDERK
jgi:cytochrome c biogenesis protein CcmG, thiol:disulfide interchange protein DsbE